MASFKIAYDTYIKPAEGYYVNNPADKGGETYAGIARNFFPNWQGWTVVDFYKRFTNPNPPTNTKIPGLEGMVEEFFKVQFWDRNRFSEINNQDIANIIFDWNVNSGSTGIKKVQQILGVGADGAIGPITLNAINSANQKELYNAIKIAREQFYYSLVNANPTQSVFLKGWLARLAKFPDLITTAPGATGLAIGLGLLFFLGYQLFKPKKLKTRTA